MNYASFDPRTCSPLPMGKYFLAVRRVEVREVQRRIGPETHLVGEAVLQVVRTIEGEGKVGEHYRHVRMLRTHEGAGPLNDVYRRDFQFLQEHRDQVVYANLEERKLRHARSPTYVVATFTEAGEQGASYEDLEVITDWVLSKGLTEDDVVIDLAGGVYIKPGALTSR